MTDDNEVVCKSSTLSLKRKPKERMTSLQVLAYPKKGCRKFLFLFVHISPLLSSLYFPHDWNVQCYSTSVHFWKSIQIFWNSKSRFYFFNMHIITSKLVTNNLHTQYINMKSKSRCFCLSLRGKVLSPSTCLTNISQDLSLLIHVLLSRRNEPSVSGTMGSIVYTV